MSELTYEHANAVPLGPFQSAYKITNGIHTGTIVRTTLTKNEVDLDNDNIIDQINYKITASIIDNENNVLAHDGIPLTTPGKVESIHAAAIAEGAIQVPIEKARMIDEAIFRALRMKTVIETA